MSDVPDEERPFVLPSFRLVSDHSRHNGLKTCLRNLPVISVSAHSNIAVIGWQIASNSALNSKTGLIKNTANNVFKTRVPF